MVEKFIKFRLNVCRKNEHETTELCRKIMEEVMVKNLENSAPEFHILTDNTVCGLRSLEPFLDTDAFYKIFYELHKCTCKACLTLKIIQLDASQQLSFNITDQKEVSMYSSVIYTFKKSTLSSLSEFVKLIFKIIISLIFEIASLLL